VTFIWPTMLLLILAIPLGAAGYVALERRRRRRVAAYGIPTDPGPGAVPARLVGLRRRIASAFILVGLAMLGRKASSACRGSRAP